MQPNQNTEDASTAYNQSVSLVIPPPQKIQLLDSPLRDRLYPLFSTDTPEYLKRFYFSKGNQQFRFTEQGTTIQIEATRPEHQALTSSASLTASSIASSATASTSSSCNNDSLLHLSSSLRKHPSSPESGLYHRKRQQDALSDSNPPEPSGSTSNAPPDDGSPVPLPSPANSSTGDEEEIHYASLQTLQNFSNIISTYETLPSEMQRALLTKLLSVTDRSSLSMMAESIVPSLRCDFLTLLPIELVYNVLSQLDFKTLCSAAQVSRDWRRIVDSSETIWKNRLVEDELAVTDDEVRRALDEEWDYTSWGHTANGKVRGAKKFADIHAPPINIYKAIYRRKYLIIHNNWMIPNYKPKPLTIEGNGSDVVTCLQFDDDKIITGSDDHTITVYNSQTGEKRTQLQGHEGGVWALQYVGNSLVSGSTDRTVRVWDIKRGRCTHCFTGHTSTVRCLEILMPVQIGVDPVTSAPIMAPKFPVIITGSRDATLRVWKLPENPVDPEIIPDESAPPENSDGYFLRVLQGHASSVRALSGHGNTVVSGSYDTTVRVWNIETGDCRWVLTGHAQRVYSAVLDYKRNRCISGSMDWFVKVWSLDNGSLLYTLEGHTSLVGLLDLNRTTLVSAAADSTLRVWDPDNGNFLHKLQGHQGAITCFQHDEYKVVSGSERTLKLWNIRTGELVQDLLDGLTRIWQVRFDQRRCVAAVQRNEKTFIEVLDFDYDPYEVRSQQEGESSTSAPVVTGDAGS